VKRTCKIITTIDLQGNFLQNFRGYLQGFPQVRGHSVWNTRRKGNKYIGKSRVEGKTVEGKSEVNVINGK